MKTVIGMFDNRTIAQEVQEALTNRGIRRDEIQIIDKTAEAEYVKAPKKKEGFWESLFQGISGTEQDRTYYSQGVSRGGCLVVVTTDDARADIARTVMESRGGEIQKGTGAAAATTKAGEKTIPVIEEKLKVGKQAILGTGGVRVFSRVTEKPVEEKVRLRDETVRVERKPVDRPLTAADASAFKEETIEIQERKEQAIVQKEARVVEEVTVGKDVQERTEIVRDKVRRMDVDVQKIPAGSVGATRYDSTFEQDFRTHSSKLGRGLTYEQCQPAYSCGYELGTDPRYGKSEWSVVEPEARRRFEATRPGAWEQFKDSIRYAWEKARAKLRAA